MTRSQAELCLSMMPTGLTSRYDANWHRLGPCTEDYHCRPLDIFIAGPQALSVAYHKAVGLRASQAKQGCSQAWELPCFAWKSEVAQHAEADL